MASIIFGSAVGAAIRYALFQTWPAPAHVLAATLISGIFGFSLAGFVLASGASPEIRAFVAGVCGAITTVSVYIAVGMSQPPWIAIAMITLTPVSIVAGVVIGAMLNVSLKSRRGTQVSKLR